jgi:hypothetical protein
MSKLKDLCLQLSSPRSRKTILHTKATLTLFCSTLLLISRKPTTLSSSSIRNNSSQLTYLSKLHSGDCKFTSLSKTTSLKRKWQRGMVNSHQMWCLTFLLILQMDIWSKLSILLIFRSSFLLEETSIRLER